MTQPSRRAGSGIQFAIARAFFATDNQTTVAGRSSQSLAATGLTHVAMDVRDAGSVAAALARHGPFDIFVANAGGVSTAPALKANRADWDAMLPLNLTSVSPALKRGWGRFIAIGSTVSLKDYRYRYASAFAAAKHGLLGFVRSGNRHYRRHRQRALPRLTDTPMLTSAIDAISGKTNQPASKTPETFTRANPMNRLVDPTEVAVTALSLASEQAAAVNGQAIAIDGSETA